jgi:hypothetical protein
MAGFLYNPLPSSGRRITLELIIGSAQRVQSGACHRAGQSPAPVGRLRPRTRAANPPYGLSKQDGDGRDKMAMTP